MLDLLRAFFLILNKQQKQQIKRFKLLIYFIWVIKVKIIFKKYVRLSIVGNAKMQFIAKKQSFIIIIIFYTRCSLSRSTLPESVTYIPNSGY